SLPSFGRRLSEPAPPKGALGVVALVVDVAAGTILRRLDIPGLVAADVAVAPGKPLHATDARLFVLQPEALKPCEVAAAAGSVDALGLRGFTRIDAALTAVAGVVRMGTRGGRGRDKRNGNKGNAFLGCSPSL